MCCLVHVMAWMMQYLHVMEWWVLQGYSGGTTQVVAVVLVVLAVGLRVMLKGRVRDLVQASLPLPQLQHSHWAPSAP